MSCFSKPIRALVTCIALVCAFSAPALAQNTDYPLKPIHIVVTFPPGGSSDAMVRILSPRLSDKLGQQVVVDNRPGGKVTTMWMGLLG